MGKGGRREVGGWRDGDSRRIDELCKVISWLESLFGDVLIIGRIRIDKCARNFA